MASSSSSSSPFIYSCIAYHDTILCENTASTSPSTSNLASAVLPKIEHKTNDKRTYVHGAHHIHYISDGTSDESSAAGLTYLVITDAEIGRKIPFGFLLEIKTRFLKEYASSTTDFAGLPAYGAAAFNAQLKKLMVEYGTSKAGQEDALRNVQAQIDDVRGIMTENIERVLERGERIDLLVDKTDRLGGSSQDFRMRSRHLQRKMWWKVRVWRLWRLWYEWC